MHGGFVVPGMPEPVAADALSVTDGPLPA